jgi:hypothetical protein
MAMVYAIELSPRQSARTIEQALRHCCEVVLQPRIWPEDLTVAGQLLSGPNLARPAQAEWLTLQLAWEPGGLTGDESAIPTKEQLMQLEGTYCDAHFQLSEHRYLFSSDILRVEWPQHSAPQVQVERPKSLQVAQRRRSWRFQPARSAQVELRWTRDGQVPAGSVGWLCNVSAEGLACRTEARVADQLWIGDQVVVEFTLGPGDPEPYILDAVLCNKTPAGSPGRVILGVQFASGPEHEDTVRAAGLLRQQLLARYAAARQV